MTTFFWLLSASTSEFGSVASAAIPELVEEEDEDKEPDTDLALVPARFTSAADELRGPLAANQSLNEAVDVEGAREAIAEEELCGVATDATEGLLVGLLSRPY